MVKRSAFLLREGLTVEHDDRPVGGMAPKDARELRLAIWLLETFLIKALEFNNGSAKPEVCANDVPHCGVGMEPCATDRLDCCMDVPLVQGTDLYDVHLAEAYCRGQMVAR
ncbi:hypothetical protein WDZ11_08430 [Roseomonas mucosa]|uniref:hypothetical protein n=1 Tax=Roseomonas mucosa TaxID=207340 RepID=UPI0030CAB4A7